MTNTNPEALLDSLDPDQRAVATQVSGPLAVMAGAGTGKTRAITYKIAYGAAQGVYDPSNVLAVTFTKRAAFEMRHRLAHLGVPKVQARTFHAAALRQLSHFWPSIIGGPLPEIVPYKASLVAASMLRLGLGSDKTMVRDIAAEIEWAKVSMVDSAHYEQRLRATGRVAPAGLSVDDMAKLLDVYEDAKAERGSIDFEDVLIHTCAILQEREDIAQIVRKQYRHFVVDEFQDVNALQYRLLNLWLGGRHDVCVVGDVAQTIYSFTGASPKYLMNFSKQHPGARIVELTRDYRSTPQVVAIANRLMALSSHTSGTVRLSSQRPSGPAVTFERYTDDRQEAEGVARKIKELMSSGINPHEIAVLMRTNSQSQIFEEVFAERCIPVAMSNATPFFSRESVRAALSALRAAALIETQGETSSMTLRTQVEDVLTGVGWSSEAPSGSAMQERWENLHAIVQWAEDSTASSVEAFVAELMERAQYQVEPDKNGVELATIHTAKGLEWDAVFLVGAAEGLLPISYATTEDAQEEERRLAYVAVTRARDVLCISWALARTEGARKRKRSRLFDGIWPEESHRPAEPAHAKSRRAQRKEAAEEFEETASPETLELLARLKQWRLVTSRSAKIPPFSVFIDQTLRDIATVKPKTLRQLRVISGVGDIKLDRYGADVLALVRGEAPPTQ